MQLESLSIFCDVVRQQSFSRGASVNAVSQSAASQAVRQIEKQMGTQLIDRSKRPWRLTEEGKIFFKASQEIVEQYRELEGTLRLRKQPSKYTVRLAAIYSIRFNDLVSYVDRFRDEMPGAEVDVSYMHPNQVYEQVLNDRCDLGLLSFANPGRELTAIPWQEQPMVVACSANHRLASRDPKEAFDLLDLSGEAFVAFDRGLPVRREVDRYLRRHDINIRIVAEFDSIENIKRAIEDGAGIALLPEPTLRQEVETGTLFQQPLPETLDGAPLGRPISIIRRRRRRLNPAVTEFIRVLQDVGNKEPIAIQPVGENTNEAIA